MFMARTATLVAVAARRSGARLLWCHRHSRGEAQVMEFVDRVRVEEAEAEGMATVVAAAAGEVAVAGVVVVVVEVVEVASSTRLLKPAQRIWSCRMKTL